MSAEQILGRAGSLHVTQQTPARGSVEDRQPKPRALGEEKFQAGLGKLSGMASGSIGTMVRLSSQSAWRQKKKRAWP